jgi:hypothetical protein
MAIDLREGLLDALRDDRSRLRPELVDAMLRTGASATDICKAIDALEEEGEVEHTPGPVIGGFYTRTRRRR